MIYDLTGKNLGADYSRWNDVYLTLRGQYGVRSTLADGANPLSSVMHVAAPIMHQQNIIGVVTVLKPNLSFQPYLIAAEQNLIRKVWLLSAFAGMAGLLISWLLSQSVRRLAGYADAVRQGQNVPLPKVSGPEFKQLADAMVSMKEELQGKKYVENYVHTLAHQLKTPIASIKSAAELLTEDMDAVQRRRFVGNIGAETRRLQHIVNYMLSLAALENRPQLENRQIIALKPLVNEIIRSHAAVIDSKSLSIINLLTEQQQVEGEAFLLQQALTNLLSNALDFSPPHGEIEIRSESDTHSVSLLISDQGPGIPEFARERLFERFYSLPRPGHKQKSTGLGLCFVKEIARLHGGSVRLDNRLPQGTTATLRLNVN